MTDDHYSNEVDMDAFTEALTSVLPIFKGLNSESRERLLQTIATIFGFDRGGIVGARKPSVQAGPMHSQSETVGVFSQDRSMVPKEFMVQKRPRTDIERVACLGFYLTHYRDTPHFKTLDISKLNTEAAQPKFTNAAWGAPLE